MVSKKYFTSPYSKSEKSVTFKYAVTKITDSTVSANLVVDFFISDLMKRRYGPQLRGVVNSLWMFVIVTWLDSSHSGWFQKEISLGEAVLFIKKLLQWIAKPSVYVLFNSCHLLIQTDNVRILRKLSQCVLQFLSDNWEKKVNQNFWIIYSI